MRIDAGEYYETPKEIWGFLTEPGAGKPAHVARDFLVAKARLFKLGKDLAGLAHQKTIPGLGAHHVIFQQKHLGLRVHRAYVTVHMGRDLRVYMAKNRSIPAPLLPPEADFRWTRRDAVRKARQRVRRASTLQDTESMWFARDDQVLPVYRVRLACTRPREEWIVYVNARTGGIVSRYDNLSKVRGRARVFDPSPVTALGDHVPLLGKPPPPAAYRTVTLFGLNQSGDLSGERVTTRPTRKRIRRSNHRYFIPSTKRGFEEVMVYHHIDSAVRYLERRGYTGQRALFKRPIRVDVNGTREDNSWYSPWEKLLTFGTGAIDDAEDGETILHEFGHALQDSIVPDFGQSEEAAAMGEGFGDYLAASFFAHRKPAPYRPCVMTWDGLEAGLEEGLDPPCLRRVDRDWRYGDFEAGGDEHDNGEIWSATLWDIFKALGREVADAIIIDSHFQLDGFTKLRRGARAIIDADRNLHGGKNRSTLRAIFRDRGIGPV